jgi:hypothetical protein
MEATVTVGKCSRPQACSRTLLAGCHSKKIQTRQQFCRKIATTNDILVHFVQINDVTSIVQIRLMFIGCLRRKTATLRSYILVKTKGARPEGVLLLHA